MIFKNSHIKITLFFILFSSPCISISQEYLFSYKKEIISLIDTNENTVIIQDSSNFLFVTVDASGGNRIDAMYRFNEEEICDSIELRYYCSQCVEFHIQDLLSDKYYKWCKVNETSYLSKKRTSFEIWTTPENNTIGSIMLTIKRISGRTYCATATYHQYITSAKKWKEMTKKENLLSKNKKH